MTKLRPSIGLLRSLLIYYGIPFRRRRLRRFYAQFIRPDSLCFDVGAHVGNRIRAWRDLGARVVAIEPHPDLASLLDILYGRDKAVTVIAAALGSDPGEATLLVSRSNLTVSTLAADWTREVQRDAGFRHLSWQPDARVPVTTLSALVHAHGLPDFVKIDVEGFEAEVLAGLDRPLPCLSFEYLPAVRQRAISCIDRLEVLGEYRFNWSEGETHRLVSPDWLSVAEIRRFIERLPATARSGDIYACCRGLSPVKQL